jgi:cytochrome P450
MAHAHTPALPSQVSSDGPRLRRYSDLPGPKPWPLVGNAGQMRTERLHLDIEQWVRTYGPVMRVSIGPLKIMVVSDNAVIAGLLRDRPDGIRRPERVTEILNEMGLKSGVFNAEGEAWQKQRRMVMAGFLPTQVRAYHPSLLKVADRLKGRWQRAAREGQTLDLLPELMRYTVDGVAGLAFGTDVNTLESEGDVIQDHLDKVFPAWFKRITAVVPYWRFVKLPVDRALDRSVKAINIAIDEFIAQGRRRLADDPALRAAPRNLLDAMIVAADQPDSGVSHDDIAGNVMTMLLAGEDTTATTIAWLLHLLHRHRNVLDKVRAEVTHNETGHADLSPEHLASMSYLDACINETLRMKPVAPFAPMETLKDMVIHDVAVPAGTLIWAVQRHDAMDPANVPTPGAFLPERWLEGEGTHGSTSSLKKLSIPFGAGPRVCPGRHLAITEIKMATAMLLTNFEIDSVDTADGQAPAERLAFTMGPVGLQMRLRERI